MNLTHKGILAGLLQRVTRIEDCRVTNRIQHRPDQALQPAGTERCSAGRKSGRMTLAGTTAR